MSCPVGAPQEHLRWQWRGNVVRPCCDRNLSCLRVGDGVGDLYARGQDRAALAAAALEPARNGVVHLAHHAVTGLGGARLEGGGCRGWAYIEIGSSFKTASAEEVAPDALTKQGTVFDQSNQLTYTYQPARARPEPREAGACGAWCFGVGVALCLSVPCGLSVRVWGVVGAIFEVSVYVHATASGRHTGQNQSDWQESITGRPAAARRRPPCGTSKFS